MKLIKDLESKDYLRNNDSITVIINGKQWKESGNNVYIQYRNNNIEFYTKTKSNEVLEDKRVITNNDILYELLNKTTNFGFPSEYNAEKTDYGTITYNNELHMLFIESKLYTNLKEFISKQDPYKVDFIYVKNDDNKTKEKITNFEEVQRSFMKLAFNNYIEIITSKKVNSFIKKTSILKFYNTLGIFVPLFINIKYLFNPFLDPRNPRIKETKLFKFALEKDRVKEIGDTLSLCMLTHKEICVLLNMSHFYRFTTDFINKLLIGFLIPNDIDFPNRNTIIYVAPKSLEIGSVCKKIYNLNDYNKTKNNLKNANIEDTKRAEELLKILDSYERKTTLEYYLDEIKKLGKCGINSIDFEYSKYDVLNYLKTAELL